MNSSMVAAALPLPLVFSDQTIKNQKFAITSYPADGLGDLVAGVALVRLLQDQGVPVDKVSFCTRSSKDMRPFIHQLRGSEIVSKEEVLAIHDVAMHIMLPVPVSSFLSEYLATDKPVFVVSEYGAVPFQNTLLPPSHFRTRSLGLNREKGELGIFITRELVRWSAIPDRCSIERRIQEFQKLSLDLQVELLKTTSSEQEFFQNKSVYFGYATNPASLIAFLLAVSALPGREHKDIVAIFPKLDPAKTKEQVIPFLSELQAEKVQFSTHQGGASPSSSPSSWQLTEKSGIQRRTISILSGNFLQEEVVSFLKFSEAETIATGDQSMSLAISSRKSAVYEARSHKKEFAEQLRHFFGPEVAFDIPKVGYCSIEAQRDLYRSYFLHTLQDQGQSLKAAQERVIFEHDCQGPLVREIESMYHDWRASQRGPLPFLSLYQRQGVIDFQRDIPYDVPTILHSDSVTYFDLFKDRMRESVWQVEYHLGFAVVLRSRPMILDHMPQAASSEHRDPPT